MDQDGAMGTEQGASPVGTPGGRPGPARPAEATMLYLQKQVELAVRSHLDELLKPAEITALQYTALTVLERHPNLTSAQLARNSFVTTQSMADMVTTLTARGLIERHRDPADRRRLVISLTADGSALIRRYRGKVKDLERRMLSGLTDQQAEDLRRYLYACRVALSDEPPH
jgi:DNA-binding MarR family transcriptional regulator